MRHIAIVGAGPAGFYTAEAALKALGDAVRIDILDLLPTPYGLIRAGVAPDHQSIKAVSRRYEQVAADPRVRLLGDLAVGRDISVDELRAAYHDVVLAVGAPLDRPLGIPGEDLPGVLGSAAFVGWYNGHPDFRHLAPPLDGRAIAVVGNGNVAIDCARILAKTRAELHHSDIAGHALAALEGNQPAAIHLLGRRGPHQASFTLKEVGELGDLDRATPRVRIEDFPPPETDQTLETGQRRVVEVLRRFAGGGPDPAKPIVIAFDFFRRPLRLLGDRGVEAIEVMRTRLDAGGRAVDTGEVETIPCGLVVAAIGYRTTAIEGVPFDSAAGRFVNADGAVAPGLWCVGWAKRGPTGTIGTNRADGIAVIARLVEAAPTEPREGGPALDRLLAARGLRPVDHSGWQRIDAAEIARARPGAPREKFVDLDDMRAAIRA